MSLIISDLKINQELDLDAMRALSGGGFFSNLIKEAPGNDRLFRRLRKVRRRLINRRRRKASLFARVFGL